MHPRNRHPGRYDFRALVAASPELARFVGKNAHGDISIDFANPEAVKALNGALLKSFYGISGWDIPQGYLCPPIPGRSDYIHSIADLLADNNDGRIPRGDRVRVLDVGVGASLIYPIIGRSEYEWSFVGTDVDDKALASARRILEANPKLASGIELRLQSVPENILKGVVQPDERFDLVVCNPPFHSSLEEAEQGSRRKWRNLGRAPSASTRKPKLNFGGQSGELWCPGGEVAFIGRMIDESAVFAKNVFCYSSLVSKDSSLDDLYERLNQAEVADTATIEILHGQKKSRIVAWTFLNQNEQDQWRKRWT